MQYICTADISIVSCEFYKNGICTHMNSKCGFRNMETDSGHLDVQTDKTEKWFEKYYR